MIDKKTESDLRLLKEFLEFWSRFHYIYNSTVSREIISKEDEDKFLQTKEMIRQKYEDLKKRLDVKYMPHSRLTDPVSDVLSITGVRFMAEKNLKRLSDDWRDSYVFLNSIMERLKSRKRRLSQFNPIGVYFKRMFEGKQAREAKNLK
jgi:hypothetical protein